MREYVYAERLNGASYIGFKYSQSAGPKTSRSCFFFSFFGGCNYLVFSFSGFWKACDTAVSGLSAIGHYQVPIDKGTLCRLKRQLLLLYDR